MLADSEQHLHAQTNWNSESIVCVIFYFSPGPSSLQFESARAQLLLEDANPAPTNIWPVWLTALLHTHGLQHGRFLHKDDH